MKMVEELITPERARKLLELNRVNRRLRPSWVKNLKGRMERGEWKLTHQGVAIGSDGMLTDGQHRLHAIVLLGKPVKMMVFYDTPPDTFGALDQGKIRTVEDLLGMKKEICQPASFLARLTYGPSASAEQIHSVLKGLKDAPRHLDEASGTKRKGVSSAPVRAAGVLQMVRGVPKDYVCDLYRMLVTFDTANPAMPPIAHSFLKQATGVNRMGGGMDEQVDLFVRSLVVFDPIRSQAAKMQVKDHDQYLQAARRDVLQLIEVRDV